MYRIVFVVDGGYWTLKFLKWGIFWVPVTLRDDTESPSPPTTPLKFKTYEEAQTYVTEMGIDQAYSFKQELFYSGREA